MVVNTHSEEKRKRPGAEDVGTLERLSVSQLTCLRMNVHPKEHDIHQIITYTAKKMNVHPDGSVAPLLDFCCNETTHNLRRSNILEGGNVNLKLTS